jgi:nucleotide-binding universal stress UspA family protein
MKASMKLLIGYDGSQCANAALDDLRRAGLPRDAEAIVLSVSEFWLPHNPANNTLPVSPPDRAPAGLSKSGAAAVTGAKPVTEARSFAMEAKRRLQVHFPQWEINAEESSGSPAREILKKADEWSPDLIAVGSQGRSGLGRFLLGSVSQKVANEAHCSVRVARGTAWKDGAPVRILLALDGSACSAAAVHAVATRMWPLGSEVRLITVVDPSNAATDSSAVRGDGREWVEEFVQEAAKKLRGLDLVVSTRIEAGDPKQLIIVSAEEWGADCIFVGASCAQTPFEKFLLGSVATAVVSRAHCSVEVVRAAADLLV